MFSHRQFSFPSFSSTKIGFRGDAENAESENLPRSVREEGGENRDQIRNKICRSLSNFSISFEFCLIFFLARDVGGGRNKR
jgi:hypothetical protein